jgi:hypothetical protein
MTEPFRFPRIVAVTLSGKSLLLPDAIGDDIGLVVLAFRRHAQSTVDSWIHPISRTLNGHVGFCFYEVPILSGGWRMMSGFIDGGMRSGVAVHLHDHVATYYGNTERVTAALSITDVNTAHAFLVDGAGAIHWRQSGWANQSGLEAVPETVRRYTQAR